MEEDFVPEPSGVASLLQMIALPALRTEREGRGTQFDCHVGEIKNLGHPPAWPRQCKAFCWCGVSSGCCPLFAASPPLARPDPPALRELDVQQRKRSSNQEIEPKSTGEPKDHNGNYRDDGENLRQNCPPRVMALGILVIAQHAHDPKSERRYCGILVSKAHDQRPMRPGKCKTTDKTSNLHNPPKKNPWSLTVGLFIVG